MAISFAASRRRWVAAMTQNQPATANYACYRSIPAGGVPSNRKFAVLSVFCGHSLPSATAGSQRCAPFTRICLCVTAHAAHRRAVQTNAMQLPWSTHQHRYKTIPPLTDAQGVVAYGQNGCQPDRVGGTVSINWKNLNKEKPAGGDHDMRPVSARAWIGM